MDPVGALGLAANIVQFIAFGHKLLSSVKEIISSPRGTTDEIEHMTLLTVVIKNINLPMLESALFQNDPAKILLREITQESLRVADKLMEKLSKLQVKQTGVARKFEAFAVASKYWWTKDEIHGLKTRLFELESRLAKWWEAEKQK